MQIIQIFDNDLENFNKYMKGLMSITAQRKFEVIGEKTINLDAHFRLYPTTEAAYAAVVEKLTEETGQVILSSAIETGNFNENGMVDRINKELDDFHDIVVKVYTRGEEPAKVVSWSFLVRKQLLDRLMGAYRQYLRSQLKKS